jgi:hypothetical protein
VTEDRSKPSRAVLFQERTQRLGMDKGGARMSDKPLHSKRPATPGARRTVHCEIDGLPAELDREELSGAGVFVVTTQPPAVDSEISIFLRVDEQRFEMTGIVVQVLAWEDAAKGGKKPGYAVLFTNLSDAERKRLMSVTRAAREASHPPAALPPRNLSKAGASAPAAEPGPTSKAPNKQSPSLGPSAPAPDPAEFELLELLKNELKQIDEKTAWAVLGVSQGADAPTIKKAFYDASKRYHPHLFARYAHHEIKRVVTELFIAHKRAFTTMTKLNKSTRATTRH